MSINLGDNSKVKLRALCNSYCVRILFDQIRTIYKKRRKGKLGEVESSYWHCRFGGVCGYTLVLNCGADGCLIDTGFTDREVYLESGEVHAFELKKETENRGHKSSGGVKRQSLAILGVSIVFVV